nr:hypothetical protein [Tanacetum cinerariifolium]
MVCGIVGWSETLLFFSWWFPEVKVSRILAWQHHEHGVCNHGGLDTLLSGSALANLSHYTFSHVGLDLVETGRTLQMW